MLLDFYFKWLFYGFGLHYSLFLKIAFLHVFFSYKLLSATKDESAFAKKKISQKLTKLFTFFLWDFTTDEKTRLYIPKRFPVEMNASTETQTAWDFAV